MFQIKSWLLLKQAPISWNNQTIEVSLSFLTNSNSFFFLFLELISAHLPSWFLESEVFSHWYTDLERLGNNNSERDACFSQVRYMNTYFT